MCGTSTSCARRRVEVDGDEDALAEELVEAELSGEHVADGAPPPTTGRAYADLAVVGRGGRQHLDPLRIVVAVPHIVGVVGSCGLHGDRGQERLVAELRYHIDPCDCVRRS